jgi:predicted metal-dependent peptidase
MLQIAAQRMAATYPFHAHFISAGRFSADSTVETMGVTVRGAELVFFFSPAFICQCSYDELAGLLHHEFNHVLFGHVLADPNRYPDTEARIVAEEVTANEWVREPLPGRPITLDQFPALPQLEDTETRYARLAQKTVLNGPKSGRSGRKTGPSVPNSGHAGPKSARKMEEMSHPTPIDNHDVWREARKNRTVAKLVISSALRQARAATSDSEWRSLPNEIRQRVQQLACGTSSGRDAESLSSAGRKHSVNWRVLLRRYVAKAVQRRPVFDRPPRRLPHLVGVVPSHSIHFVKPVVMAVIDTSGSMDAQILNLVSAELRHLARHYQVVIVECDAEIQAVYDYRGPIETVHGRGGTDLRPPFEDHFLAKTRPDVIAYFTDGDGPAPDTASKVPTVWCLTPDSRRPAKWGVALRIG